MKEFKKVKKHLNVYIVTKHFARKNIMKKHERTHTDEKPYICLQCILGTFRSLQGSTWNQSDQNLHKDNGLTPLHMTSGKGKYEVCKILVKAWRKEDFTNVIFVILTSHKKAKKYNWKNVWSLLDLNPTLSSFFLSKSLGLTLVKNIMDVLFCDKMFAQNHYLKKYERTYTGKKNLMHVHIVARYLKKIRI